MKKFPWRFRLATTLWAARLVQASTLALAVAAASVLGACSRNDARDGMDTSGRSAGQTADRPVPAAASGASGAMEPASNAVSDTAITAGVKTRLAADTQLSALGIKVETSAGRVALHGTAPDTAARTHATELARSVAGVVDVDNSLSVQATAK